MIYVGYQGIGKSTLANKDLKYIDLESSNTFIDGKRPERWETMYVNFAVCLSKQGYNVFISSHKVVRHELLNRNIEFVSIIPSISLKEQWVQKLENRYNITKSEKDFKALANAKDCFEENIKDIKKDSLLCWEITTMDYDLKNFLEIDFGFSTLVNGQGE